ncbi:MAG: hypothetical protein WBW73_16705 [Rhodoplanes sp.]
MIRAAVGEGQPRSTHSGQAANVPFGESGRKSLCFSVWRNAADALGLGVKPCRNFGFWQPTAGDEFGRTQRGNNNAYCQDNEISWLNWDWGAEDQELHNFAQVGAKAAAAVHEPNISPSTKSRSQVDCSRAMSMKMARRIFRLS